MTQKQIATSLSYKVPKNKVLVLRKCNHDMSSYYDNSFIWPKSGFIKAPRWRRDTQCGDGLHGWLWGEGDGHILTHSIDDKWLVVEVFEKDIVNLIDKVKFSSGNVVFCGKMEMAAKIISRHAPPDCRVIGLNTKSKKQIAIGGDIAKIYNFHNHGIVITGRDGISIASGYQSFAKSISSGGAAITDEEGISTSSYYSKSGNGGISKASYFAITGINGTAITNGCAMGGFGSVLIFNQYGNRIIKEVKFSPHDKSKNKLIPDTLYHIGENEKVVKVTSESILQEFNSLEEKINNFAERISP